MKEQFFRPLECAPAGGVTVGHSVTLIHIAHMMVIIRLSCPATVLPSSQPWFWRGCLLFSILLSSVLGLMACLSCSAWQNHNSKSVSSPNHQITQWKKRNCPCIICGHVLLSSSSVLSLSHGLLSRAVLCTVCPSPGIRGLLEKYPTVFFYANTWWIII